MWELMEGGDAERAIAQIEELPPDQQKVVLAIHGTRETLIDLGQEQAIKRIESSWTAAPPGSRRQVLRHPDMRL